MGLAFVGNFNCFKNETEDPVAITKLVVEVSDLTDTEIELTFPNPTDTEEQIFLRFDRKTFAQILRKNTKPK